MPIAAILLAACCWGSLGITYDVILRRYPTDPITVVTIRAVTATLILIGVLALKRVSRHDLAAFRRTGTAVIVLIGGVFSTAIFYIALIYAFREAGVAVAIVLLYLGPALVVAGSRALFKTPIDARQYVAVALTIAGVVGVSGLLSGGSTFTLLGVALGLLSAAAYASYSLVGRKLLQDVSPMLVVTSILATGAVCLLAVNFAVNGAQRPDWSGVAIIALVNGIGTTLAPMLLYTWGMSRIGAPRASILATLEPVVGVTLAFLVLGERLAPAQLAGACLVGMSLVLAAMPARSR